MFALWNFFITKRAFSYVLAVVLFLAGIYSVFAIPKESAPEVDVPVAIISTAYPGAGAEDVEKQITDEIESAVSGLDNVNKTSSISRESVSIVTVEFDASANVDKSVDKVSEAIDLIKSRLPEDANDPIVSKVDFVNQPVLLVSVTSDRPIAQLIAESEKIKNEILSVPGVSKVEIGGLPDREINVVISTEALNKYNLGVLDVSRALSLANASLPVGSIDIDNTSYTVRLNSSLVSADDVSAVPVAVSSDKIVYIRDLALVSDGTSNLTSISRASINGQPSEPAVSFSVYKRTGGDVTKITKAVRDKLAELGDVELKDGKILISFDTGQLVNDDLGNLTNNGLQAILLVAGLLFIFIGWREALLASISVPLSIAYSFIGLNLSGNTINFVSLFALILAVGILVDNSTVVVEGLHVAYSKNPNKLQATRSVIKEFAWPLITGTLTTVAAFVPLFLISGVTGEFIASIPYTILFVLIAAMFVALGVVPVLAIRFLGVHSYVNKLGWRERLNEKVSGIYGRILDTLFSSKKIQNTFLVGLIIIFIFSLSMPVIGLVRVEFFPQEDIDYVYVEYEAPTGTVLGKTDMGIRLVEDILYKQESIESFVTTIGSGSLFTDGTTGSHLANITILLDKNREQRSSEVVSELRQKINKLSLDGVRVSEPNNGPPTGAPVAISLVGDSLDKLEEAAELSIGVLQSIPGTVDVLSTSRSGGIDYVLNINRDEIARLGLDPQTVALTLRSAILGQAVTDVIKKGDDVDVVIKANLNKNFLNPNDTNRTTIDSVRYLPIVTPSGKQILLGSIVDVAISSSPNVIRHKNGERVMTVTSQVSGNVTARDVISQFDQKISSIDLPDEVVVETGGETEDADQSFRDMFIALIVSVALITAVLILEFNSIRYAFYVVAIVPFSLIGLMFGLSITGKALSFPSLMGFIALSGIVVNNSIFLIDVINSLRRRNPDVEIKEIIKNGSLSRLRPILLTTLTTVVGISPLILTSELWAPLAYAIIFGLSFAVVITLGLVPVLYSRWPGRLPEE